jgi:hypothetical protein
VIARVSLKIPSARARVLRASSGAWLGCTCCPKHGCRRTGQALTWASFFPIPVIRNNEFREAAKREEQGLYRTIYRWSLDDDRRINAVWNGKHPEDSTELIVADGIPDGFAPLDPEAESQLSAPGVEAGFMQKAVARLFW